MKNLALAFTMAVAGCAYAQNEVSGIIPESGFSVIENNKSNTYASDFNVSKMRRGSDAWEEGAKVVTIGYGFPNMTKTLFKTYEGFLDYKVSGIGPIHAKFDYGISDLIGLGLSFRYSNSKVEWSYSDYDDNNNLVNYSEGWKGSVIGVIARINFHFATSEKLDPYAGIGMGYVARSFEYFNTQPGYINLVPFVFPIPFGMELTTGIRYYFSDNVGVYAEVGIGGSIAQAGLALKF